MADERQDIFGAPLDADDLAIGPQDLAALNAAAEDEESPEGKTDDATQDLPHPGTVPTDPEAARKYWQTAYNTSRVKDREKYSKIQAEHEQYRSVLANFYQDDAYAKSVLAQRFPQLAGQVGQPGQPPGGGTPGSPGTGLTQQLQQSLGEFGFLAPALGTVLERVIQEQVQQRVKPLETRTAAQSEQARRSEEDKLLADMDATYPGWEESFGTQMKDLDEFLASDRLSHPTFGSKYALYYRLLNRGASRVEASHEMGAAARRRGSLSRNGERSVPNIEEQVRKADSARSAFQLAARAALGEAGDRSPGG